MRRHAGDVVDHVVNALERLIPDLLLRHDSGDRRLKCVQRGSRDGDLILGRRDSQSELQLDFRAAVEELTARGFGRLLCEGGPGILAQVVAAGLLDELCLTLSPMLVAGASQRILQGPPMSVPSELRLARVLENEDFLLLRYAREAASR